MKPLTIPALLLLSTLNLNALCQSNTIQSNGEQSLYDILQQLSSVCELSLIIKDPLCTQQLKNLHPLIYIKEKSLKDSMDTLLYENGLFYTLKNNTLHIDLFKTQTFKIDYISTHRNSISSTEVSISRNDGDINTYKLQGNLDRFTKSSGSQSGINITTEDGFNLWANIEQEIKALLHRPGDMALGQNLLNPVIINKGAGLITVTGNKDQLERINSYLKALKHHLSKQVMIDLSILNVTYHRSNTIGIDWNQLYNLQNITNIPPNGSNKESFISFTRDPNGTSMQYSINLFPQSLSLNRVVEFLEGYGRVHTLSNPKLLTLNNQPAMISVGDVIRYRKSTVFQSNNTNSTTTNTDTEYPSVFAGVLLDITPSVFGDEIMLKINPSITRLKGRNIQNAAQALDSPPNLSANQLSSIIHASHGKRVIIGGLISKSSDVIKEGIPLLNQIPILGYLFSYESEKETLNEMILVITPYIIDSEQPIPSHLLPHLQGNDDAS